MDSVLNVRVQKGGGVVLSQFNCGLLMLDHTALASIRPAKAGLGKGTRTSTPACIATERKDRRYIT